MGGGEGGENKEKREGRDKRGEEGVATKVDRSLLLFLLLSSLSLVLAVSLLVAPSRDRDGTKTITHHPSASSRLPRSCQNRTRPSSAAMGSDQ